MSLEQLERMFVDMRAQTSWDVDGPLLWGYYFIDADRAKLHLAAKELAQKGYRAVRIYRSDDGEFSVLHVELVETHTPQTLHARNIELTEFAESLGLWCYDGMDVGNVISPHGG